MTSCVGKQVKVVVGKDGKPRLERRRGYVTKNAILKRERLVKAWLKKGQK